MSSCKATTIEHERDKCKIVSVLKGTRGVPALNYVPSFGTSWEATMQTVSTKYPT